MGAEFDFPMAVIIQRPNVREIVRRNVKVSAGDDFRIVLTAYADEDASEPLEVAGQVALLTIGRRLEMPFYGFYGYWCDYGWPWSSIDEHWANPIKQVKGAIQQGTGQIIFSFQPPLTQNLHGRYPFQVQLQSSRFGATVLRGFLDVERGFILPGHTSTVFILDESFLDGPDELADG